MEYTELEALLPQIEWACRYSLSVKRYNHVERVIRYSRELAERYEVEPLRVQVAAAGHDIARELQPERLVKLADRYAVPQEDPLREQPLLLHGPVAAGMLAEEYGVEDESILSAVYHHTLGSPKLDEVGKIVYVADYTEPGRSYFEPGERDGLISGELDKTVAAVIVHASRRFGPISDRTRAFYNAVTSTAGAPW
ncbi:MAG: bis(5'-nucleosyl)-tetraphosphatase (symmetrical) YqeK [Alkalispirochaetaceae bacterium]